MSRPASGPQRPRASENRLTLSLLLLAFLAPVLLAWFAYVQGTRPGSVAHGTLVDPPRPFPAVEQLSPDGGPLPEEVLRGRWTLLLVVPGASDATARAALDALRQVRLAVGEDMRRVSRLWLVGERPSDEALAELRASHPDLTVGVFGVGAAAALVRELPEAGGPPGSAARGAIYIVDPLGNLAIGYPIDAEPRGILDDLQRLLKVSRIG